MENSGFTYNALGTVSGVFFTKPDADHAYEALLNRGYSSDEIAVLMSDETLSKHEQKHPRDVREGRTGEEEDMVTALGRTTGAVVGAFISLMVSIPELGIAISKTLVKTFKAASREESIGETIATTIRVSPTDESTGTYGNGMKEGGIIISVDPRNLEERRAIVKNFRENNGHDILGDDGYTELDVKEEF
jgi:hypothetical protein